MFYESLDKYGHLHALGFKRQGSWEHITYSQYYLLARKVAKGFLKVRSSLGWPFPPGPSCQHCAFTASSPRTGPHGALTKGFPQPKPSPGARHLMGAWHLRSYSNQSGPGSPGLG